MRTVKEPAYEDLLAVADLADEVCEMIGKYLGRMYTRGEFDAAVFGPGRALRLALRKAGYRSEGESAAGFVKRKT